MFAVLVVLAFVVVAVLTPRIAPYSGAQLFFQFINYPQPPALHGGHLLGTDMFGHDMLTQLLWAIRETMLGSVGAALAAMLLGVCLGAPAGYRGGALDAAVGWLTGAVVTVPALGIFVFVVIRYNPVPLWAFPVTLALALWTYVARAVRASFASLRAREFVEAARAAGASGPRIVFRHLLPNSAGLVVVAATGVLGQSVMIISTTDFFGLGNEQTDKPTLGGLIANAAKSGQLPGGLPAPWWLWAIPIVTLGVLLVCANVSADTLDDILDPARSR